MSSVPGRQTGRLQTFPTGLSRFPSRHSIHTHTHTRTHTPGTSRALSPPRICPTSLASGQLLWLKWIKDDSFLALFFSPSLLTSLFFPCRMKGLPDTHSMHIPFRPGHTGSLCAAQRGGGGGGAGWEVAEEGREGACSVRGAGGVREGGGEAREGLNASHVKLMRTNLQRWNLVFLSPTPHCYSFVSFPDHYAVNLNLPSQQSIWCRWQEQNTSVCRLFWQRRLCSSQALNEWCSQKLLAV